MYLIGYFINISMDKEEQVKKYIKKYLKKGYPEESLKKTLIDFGYSKKLVEDSFKKIKEKKKFPKIPTNCFLFTSMGVIIIILVITILFFLPKNCDYDKQCFIDNAIEGNRVFVKEDVAGSTLKYTTNGNILTKEFVKFSEDEPEEVIILLKNKKITCNFDVFNEDLIDGIFGGIENCEGELIDTIYELEIIS